MKQIITIIAALLLLSFARPWHTVRRQVVINIDSSGHKTVTPIGQWEQYFPKNDTVWEYKTY